VTAAALTHNNGTCHAAWPNTSPVARQWCKKYPSATAVTSRNNRSTVGSGVFSAVSPAWAREQRNVYCWKALLAAQWRPWLGTLVCVWQWFVKCSHELFQARECNSGAARACGIALVRRRLVESWDGRQPERTGAVEHGSWGIYDVENRYHATTSEHRRLQRLSAWCSEQQSVWISDGTIATCGVRDVVNSRVYELAMAL
jgi:hypothetical protein